MENSATLSHCKSESYNVSLQAMASQFCHHCSSYSIKSRSYSQCASQSQVTDLVHINCGCCSSDVPFNSGSSRNWCRWRGRSRVLHSTWSIEGSRGKTLLGGTNNNRTYSKRWTRSSLLLQMRYVEPLRTSTNWNEGQTKKACNKCTWKTS